LAVIFVIGGLGLTNNVLAQDTSLTTQQAIDRAKENYPSLKAASLEVERQKALKATAYDLGTTSIYTGKEEVGNGSVGVQNQLGVAQADIDVFGISAKNRLNKSQTQLAISNQILTERILIRDVSIAWYNAVSAKKQWQLYIQLDSIYADFLKAAELRFSTQQTSKVEYLSASAKYQELVVNMKQAESEFNASLQILNQYLMFPSAIGVDETVPEESSDILSVQPSDSLGTVPLIDFYKKQVDVSETAWKAEQANYLPKLDIGYSIQSVDGQSGFHGWEAGISLPLIFFSQRGKTQAAKINYEIAGQDFRQKELELYAAYKELLSRYTTMLEVLDYYSNEALPLASEQIDAANLGYKLGNLDYIQFIQNVESAIKTRQEYLSSLSEYYIIKEQLEYISGK